MSRDEAAAVLGPIFPRRLLGCSTPEEVMEAMNILEDLREAEGMSITIFCDNPDFGGENAGVDVGFEFDEFPTRFSGDTVLEALRAALAAKKAR